MLRREKIKVEYQTSHLSKIVGTLSPPTDFSFAVSSPPGVKIFSFWGGKTRCIFDCNT